ncbi:TRAP transporter small permease [Enterocloster aldenensis]|uniref:TRAP transporter small permease n=1 Tax=Enterocloster aldenensis TaxID=358742 RepID=UPI0040282E9C
MSRYTDKLFHFLDKTMETCSAIILAGMTLLIFIQVLARYIFKTPLAWSEEGARFLFIWMTFIAGYVGARKGQHIGVELIQNLFPAPIRMGMKVICDLLSAFFFLMVLYYCGTQWGKLSSQTSPALHLSMALVYLGMMLGCLGLSASYLYHIRDVLKKERSEETS